MSLYAALMCTLYTDVYSDDAARRGGSPWYFLTAAPPTEELMRLARTGLK